MYPALLPLLPLMHTPRLPVVDWTDAPVDLNGLVRFAERRDLVSARLPSHFKRGLNYQSTLRNVPEEWGSYIHRGGSRKYASCVFILFCYLALRYIQSDPGRLGYLTVNMVKKICCGTDMSMWPHHKHMLLHILTVWHIVPHNDTTTIFVIFFFIFMVPCIVTLY